jgi:hypothetical protein
MTGLLVGELLALKWSDVDFEKFQIHVSRRSRFTIEGRSNLGELEDISMKNETPEGTSLSTRHCRGFDTSVNEPFVKPEVVGEFLQLDDATVVRYANAGFLPGHPLRESGKRTHWRFLLSEIKQSMLAKRPAKRRPYWTKLDPRSTNGKAEYHAHTR